MVVVAPEDHVRVGSAKDSRYVPGPMMSVSPGCNLDAAYVNVRNGSVAEPGPASDADALYASTWRVVAHDSVGAAAKTHAKTLDMGAIR